MSETNSATFNRNGTTSYTRCYYTQSFGTAQGVLVSKNIPEKGLYGETITATDGNTYCPVVVVSDIPAGYAYTGSAISLGEKVTKGGETLVINVPEDYMLSLSGTVSSESLSDCLYVYDGSSASATKLVEISETEPTSITAKSSGTSLTLCFMSDSMIQKAGLDLTVTISKCNSLVFDANGGSGGMKNIYFRDSTAKPLTENTFTREGYTFLGWNTTADGKGTSYADKTEFSFSDAEAGATITLYAQWIEVVTLTAKADPYTKGAYYTTFYDSSVNYAVDENTEAYYVDDSGNGMFTLVKADDGIIKAGAGVILKSTGETITLLPATTTETAESLLTGTDTEKTFTPALRLDGRGGGVACRKVQKNYPKR